MNATPLPTIKGSGSLLIFHLLARCSNLTANFSSTELSKYEEVSRLFLLFIIIVIIIIIIIIAMVIIIIFVITRWFPQIVLLQI